MTSRADEMKSCSDVEACNLPNVHCAYPNCAWGRVKRDKEVAQAKLPAPAGGMPDAPIQSVVDTLLHQVRNRLDFDRSVLINVLQDIAPLRAFDKAKLANKLSAPAGMPDRPRRFCADTVGNMHIDASGGYVSADDYETLCTFAQARAEECERLKVWSETDRMMHEDAMAYRVLRTIGICDGVTHLRITDEVDAAIKEAMAQDETPR